MFLRKIFLAAFSILLPTFSVALDGNLQTKTYHIDGLKITTSELQDSACASGSHHEIFLSGSIGPDSTFAVGKLLAERKPCISSSGDTTSPIKVILDSEGGLLKDGYKLGEIFRNQEISTLILDNNLCASSCAVAFLGGTKRMIGGKGSILFHSPYSLKMNIDGSKRINCSISEEEIEELKNYYVSMTSLDEGERLFDRTMWYCSSQEGWTVTGASAAELYGIATKEFLPKLNTEKVSSIICKSTTKNGHAALQAIKGNTCPLGATRVK